MDIIATKIIEALGGTVKVAELCDISAAAVSQWKTNGIPKPQLRYLKLRFPKLDWDGLGSPRLRASPSVPQEGAGAPESSTGGMTLEGVA